MAKLDHPELVELIIATLDTLLHVEKGPALEAEGVRLHPAEIHLLLFLHARPDANATEIAKRFSVTKGAVSQTLSRLEGKGVLRRERSAVSGTELSISMTRLGDRLMAHVLRVKASAANRFDTHLAALTAAERDAVARFFRLVLRGAEQAR